MKDIVTCFISDCHSQHRKLQDALDWIKSEYPPESTQLVYLGDCWDSRLDKQEENYPPHSDPLQTYLTVRNCVDQHGDILLQSNHQDKLRRWLYHDLHNAKPNPVTVNYGLDHTINQFIKHLTVEEKVELHDWLSALPCHVVIQGYDQLHDTDVSFLCSHAYFNTAVNIQQPSKKHIQEALYGCMDRDNKRLDWWSSDEPLSFYGLPAVRVAGHYHQLWKGKYQRVIDSGCGNTGGSLCVHVPAYGLYKEF
jgi:hypothetical protein